MKNKMLHIEIINADGDLIVEYDLANNPYKVGELINIQITDYREKPLTYKINKTYTIHNNELEDLECINCEIKYRDSADIDMFGG